MRAGAEATVPDNGCDALPGPDVLDAFLAAVGRAPRRTAVIHNGRHVSYSDLATRALTVYRRLGPSPGTVGVAATHHPGTPAALLGIWAAGGTYCPIDPAFPQPRRKAMLTAAGCRVLLTPGSDGGAPGSRAPVAAGPEHPAYVLFTSGSTGEPRPVITPRRAISAAVRSLRGLFGLTAADRVLQFAALNWDTCFEEMLPTLTAGAALVIHDEAHTGSFPRLLRMVEQQRVTVLNLPTAFWQELVAFLIEDGRGLPGTVRLVVIGGEAVSRARVADWSGLDTARVRLLNTYGCTETTLITHAVGLHGPGAAGWDRAGRPPIGRALPHVVEHLSDGGELLIGGPSVATGYRGLPEATAERFVSLPGGRFFRTGDRVSRSPDGTLLPEGRVDDELKIRGIRVDPGEVESHIAGHPGVSAVAVTGITAAGRTALAACVVPRHGWARPGLEADILEFLRGRLPAHLIPGRIRLVAELAHTASGKVDRRRIKEAMQ